MPPEDESARSSGEEGAGTAPRNGKHHQPEDGGAADPFQTEGHDGSFSPDDPDRPQWDLNTVLEHPFDYHREDGTYAFTVLKGRRADGEKVFVRGRRVQGTNDLLAAKQDNELFRLPGLGNYRRGTGDEPDLLYRLPELIVEMADRPDEQVFITEGEKDADTLRAFSFMATTNPNGANSWRPEFNPRFAGRDVVVMIDNDPNGRERGAAILAALLPIVRSVKVVELPGLKAREDVTDWLNNGKTKDDLLKVVADAEAGIPPRNSDRGVRLEDFHAFMPAHNYLFAPTGEPWPASSVNSRIEPVRLFNRNGQPVVDDDGEQVRLPANRWLDQHRPVEQMTWAPGEPQIVKDRLISEGGWIHRRDCNVFNLYRPPAPHRGDPAKAGPWRDHVQLVYPDEAEHIINWLAHRVQRPQEKINHALVMGGAMGVGKDTILEPVKFAVGPWNFTEVSPKHMLGRFNGFVKSVILRLSEARDLGDEDRFAFYDHMKSYTAAPPDVLRVDEKHVREYAVFNVCGVIITTNYKTNGIYLPEDDRRHFVAWTDMTKEAFEADYWQRLWKWYFDGGNGHVAAYLAERDITAFDPKAPPPKTEAFWDIVASNNAPEEAELSDALEKLGWPEAVTLTAIAEVAESSFAEWLRDRRNNRSIPHKMDECGYKQARNPAAQSGRWKVEGKDVVIYARKQLPIRDAIAAAEKRAREGNNAPM